MTGEEANLGRCLLNVMLESWSGEWLFLPFFNVVFFLCFRDRQHKQDITDNSDIEKVSVHSFIFLA